MTGIKFIPIFFLFSVMPLFSTEQHIELKGKLPDSKVTLAIIISSAKQVKELKKKGFLVDLKDTETQKSLTAGCPEILKKLIKYNYLNPRYFKDKEIKGLKDETLKAMLTESKAQWRKSMHERVRKKIIEKSKDTTETTAAPLKKVNSAGKTKTKKPVRNVPSCVICHTDFELNHLVKSAKLSKKEHEKECPFECKHGCNHFHNKCIKQWIERKKNLWEPTECPVCRANKKK